MRKPTVLDWLAATAAWGFLSGGFGVFMHLAVQAPEELATVMGFALFFGGVVAARVWWLRRPEQERAGLTTGEAQLERMEELEMRMAEVEALHSRVAELEERLDFSERLLVRAEPHKVPEPPRA